MAPDQTVADFRKDNGRAIRQVRARFVELCRQMGLLVNASVAIDGSKFKAVNNRDRNFTRAKVERRRAQLEQSVARYLSQLDSADRQEPSEAPATKTTRLQEKLAKLAEEMQVAVDTEHYLIVTHEVTDVGSDRPQLARVAKEAKPRCKLILWRRSPIAATSAARRLWRAIRPALP